MTKKKSRALKLDLRKSSREISGRIKKNTYASVSERIDFSLQFQTYLEKYQRYPEESYFLKDAIALESDHTNIFASILGKFKEGRITIIIQKEIPGKTKRMS